MRERQRGGSGLLSGPRRTTRVILPPLQRVSPRYRCPVCGRGDWCGYNREVTVCMRVESSHPAQNGGWVHRSDGSNGEVEVEVPVPPVYAVRPATVVRRDRVYRDLLALLELTPWHQDDLLRRGLGPREIRRKSYKSIPPNSRVVVRELCRMGHDLSGVPGFYLKQGSWGRYWAFPGTPGYLIPIRDVRDRIQALQVRVDKPGSGGKYRMFSASQRKGGCSSGMPAHVAWPSGVVIDQSTVGCSAQLRGFVVETRIWVTEGALKADLTAHFLGAVVVGAASAVCWKPVLPVLDEFGASEVVLAFDRDQDTNPAVARAVGELEKAIRKKHLGRVLRASWSSEWKGVDDALAAGAEIAVQ